MVVAAGEGVDGAPPEAEAERVGGGFDDAEPAAEIFFGFADRLADVGIDLDD